MNRYPPLLKAGAVTSARACIGELPSPVQGSPSRSPVENFWVTAPAGRAGRAGSGRRVRPPPRSAAAARRSEEHTSELQSLMRISYAVFCLKKKTDQTPQNPSDQL